MRLLSNLMDDEMTARRDTLITDAIKKTGAKGAAAKMLYRTLRERVRRNDAGGLVIDVWHKITDARFETYGSNSDGSPITHNNSANWSTGVPKEMPLAAALKALLDDSGPEQILADRQDQLLEEDRQKAVATKMKDAAERLEREEQSRQHDRIHAWRNLPRDQRALRRMPKDQTFTADAFVQALASEPADEHSNPPADWRP